MLGEEGTIVTRSQLSTFSISVFAYDTAITSANDIQNHSKRAYQKRAYAPTLHMVIYKFVFGTIIKLANGTNYPHSYSSIYTQHRPNNLERWLAGIIVLCDWWSAQWNNANDDKETDECARWFSNIFVLCARVSGSLFGHFGPFHICNRMWVSVWSSLPCPVPQHVNSSAQSICAMEK